MNKKKWVIKSTPNMDKLEELCKALNISLPIGHLLLQRKVNSYQAAKTFFRPNIHQLYDPFRMDEMKKAVKRIEKSIENNELILIYGDYDVDGTTAVATLYLFLKSFYSQVIYYIPDRHKEGYCISEKGIEFAKKNDVGLFISVDCGITAFQCINYAKELNMDVIVCDHHEPSKDALPYAHAILNPKKKNCTYPFKELSGCAIVFKLVQALTKYYQLPEENSIDYLDLVAISIAADIVPMQGENKILMYFGLQKLNQNKRVGLRALLETCQLNPPLNVSQIVFQIAPKINAAGRMYHAKEVVELLITKDYNKACEIADNLIRHNTERKLLDEKITQEALELFNDETIENRYTNVAYHDTWHKGVIGIVASRCIEQYYKPTIIFSQEKDYLMGSARSIVGYNIYNALTTCKDLLTRYGGHEYAAGLTLKKRNFNDFRSKFEETVAASLDKNLLQPLQLVDLVIPLGVINMKMLKIIEQMAPFGPNNLRPVFASHDVIAIRYHVLKEKHLKLLITSKETPQIVLEAIGFNFGDYLPYIIQYQTFSLAYNIENNSYQGTDKLQLHIKDIRIP